jgi:hypothetical protein
MEMRAALVFHGPGARRHRSASGTTAARCACVHLTSQRVLGLALLVCSLSCACSSAGPDGSEAPAKPANPIHDPIVVQASAATRGELGVQTWGIYVGASSSLTVRGYDTSNELVVQFEQQTTTIDDLHGSVEISVTCESGTRTMKIAMEAQPGGAESDVRIHVLENALASDRTRAACSIASSPTRSRSRERSRAAAQAARRSSRHPSVRRTGARASSTT